MSNARWNSSDKINLMRLYSSKKSYEEIGTILNRSPNAIKLRLESIVYENLVRGKPATMLTRMLNTDIETIKQFYYSHKSFKQSRNEPVEDVVFPPTHMIPNNPGGLNNGMGMNYPISNNMINQSNQPYGPINPSNNGMNRHSVITGGSVNDENNMKQSGKYFEMIENENRMLDEIIKNYRMKRQLRKLYVDDKLDKKSRDLYEKILKK